MKKILSVFLAVTMLLSVVVFQAFAADSGQLSETISWTLNDDGDLVIEGTGEIPDYTVSPWIDYSQDVYTITIGEGITSIGQCAFKGMESVFEVNFPESLTAIGDEAFSGCIYVEAINLGDNVERIGKNAFFDCTELIEISGGNKLYEIKKGAFDGTAFVDNASAGVLYVGTVAYMYKQSGASSDIVINDGTLGIAGGAFEQKNITSVVLPDSLIYIEDEAFINAGSLSSVDFSEGIEYIGSKAFFGCKNLLSVTIPKSVENIGYRAFGWYDYDYQNVRKVEGFTINGYEGSAAQAYAEDAENQFAFVGITPETVKGDLNGDGELKFNDCTILKRYFSDLLDLSDDVVAIADMNEDGEVNARDMIAMRKIISGIA